MSLVSALQIPYREARSGFWGEQTSTLNWCEEDYNISFYCAEVINTLTNLVFMYLGLKGLRNVFEFHHSRVFIPIFLGYIIVGLGSMAFHTTLKYEMQLADELPMIYTVCTMAFATFSYRRSTPVKVLIGAALFGLALFITVYYLYAKDPVFHQVAYGLLTATTIFRGFYVMEWDLRPAMKKRNPVNCDRYMKEMYKLAMTGILMFLAGFLLWNLDNIFCRHLTHTKRQILLPWAVILEGHGWWHILTGLGEIRSPCSSAFFLQPYGGSTDFPVLAMCASWDSGTLVREIESQAIAAQQQIGLVRTQLASKQREMRLAQLTRGEISTLPPDTAVYEGVGKMFVGLSVPTLQDKLSSEVTETETEIEALGKRLHYLETTAKNSQEHIEKMLKGSGQA
ncbi:ceramidase-domain-containing protein [Podospora australis]|uniref:Ceramidase-domain-containing protein n=1 Tax=Podospora australis TaxID=1536484 RepID=A0AAN7AJ75_9PEZI|nr:ceramidase-domain-containing protein [Podospora australis]